MKNLRKMTALVLSLVMSLTMAACGSKTPATTTGANTNPVIDGVNDSFVEAGSEFDAFAGVTATDKEDGNLTDKIVVESTPKLDFKNGKAVPTAAGSYELTYSVTDKAGATAMAYATLTVGRQTSEQKIYKQYTFDGVHEADNRGWIASIGDDAKAEAALKSGAYVFDITNPGGGDGSVQLKFPGMELKAADYRIKIWAKSTADTYCHILARDEKAEGWATFGGEYNKRIGKEIAPLELFFTAPAEGSAEILLNLGKITPNGENPADTTPENFTVTIDKIEVYEISGEEHLNPVYNSEEASGVTADAGDGASASVNGSTVAIDSYPTSGGVWSIKVNLPLDTVIENGSKYYYKFTVEAENAQSGECLIESDSQYDKLRANFAGLSLAAGEKAEVSGVFTAGTQIDDPVIRLQIGNPSEGVSSNKLTFSAVEIGKVEGDKETVKTTYSFAPVGRGSAAESDPECPLMTFNGTDEDNDRGVGTIWMENGSFFYRIDNGGTVDWHNKLVLGYDMNPLTLESDSYFTVEIKAKATKEVSCGVFLNPCGGWDPRVSEGMKLTTEEQTFTFETKDTLITNMDFELLFQFGSEATAQLGEVTIEFTEITIYQKSVL